MSVSKYKILIIDDDPFLLIMYSKKFLAEGFIVNGVQTAAEGLAEAKNIKPDIILLDVMLPDEDGISLLKKLKRQKETASTPVILLSNISEQPHREQARVYGAAAYYVKACLEPAEIVDKVKKLLVS
jgi:DNA-binding response OmpR family regulator